MNINARDSSAGPATRTYGSTSAYSFAAYLEPLTFDDLPLAAKHCALRCILDLLACAAAGRASPVVDMVVANGTRWARESFPRGNAGVWFEGSRLSASGAAFVNSLAASVLDVDDGHRAASGHPGAAVIPAVLAVGETIGARLQDALLAIVCGYEAGVGVAAARSPSHVSTAATGRWAAVAVAAAVGKLRRFSAVELANAIALAEAYAPNMMAADHAGFAGSDAKEGIPWSVMTGLAAAEHAALGFKGYLAGLDNPEVYRQGWFASRDLGAFLIETAYFKPYASCRWTHSAIDAVLEMRHRGLDPATIEQIEVATFQRALSLENLVRPNDIIAAQFSIPFAVAVALLEDAKALLPMSPELLGRSDIIQMAGRVVLVLDPELEACFPAQVPARVTMKTRQGRIEREIRLPLGDPGNSLSDAQLIDKAIHLCLGSRDAEEVRRFAIDLFDSVATHREARPLSNLFDFTRQVSSGIRA